MRTEQADILDFEEDVRRSVLELRALLRPPIQSAVSEPFQPVDLHRATGADRRLSWGISRFVQDDNILEAARSYPGAKAIQRFVRCVEAKGLPHPDKDLVAEAAARFEAMIERHAGDRNTFDMMASSVAGERPREREDLRQREAAFNAMGFVLGVQAQSQISTHIVLPSKRDGLVDVASVRGYVGLRRVRPSTPWPIHVRRWSHDGGVENVSSRHRPLDPRVAATDGAPTFVEYCEPHGIGIDPIDRGRGFVEFRLPGGSVGDHAKVTCMLAEINEEVGTARRTDRDAEAELTVRVHTPVAGLLIDQLIHAELAAMCPPELVMYTDVNRIPSAEDDLHDHDRLAPLGELRHLGRASVNAMPSPAMPRYDRMTADALRLLGRSLEEFELYRAWLPFPPIASTAMFRYELPA